VSFYLGLDLGQALDPTAAVVLEGHGEPEARVYDVRYIEQFRLGTSYPDVVRAVQVLLSRPPLAADNVPLVIDHSSVGRAIYDMFVEAGLQPIGITITGGSTWHRESPWEWYVSKILLVGTVQKLLQSGRLRIGARLQHASTLQKELRDFRVKMSKAAHETYEAREGQHDDILLSVAIVCFAAEHPMPKWEPIGT
jgi:hypothetical protein